MGTANLNIHQITIIQPTMSEPKLDSSTPTETTSIQDHDSITSPDDNLKEKQPTPKPTTSSPPSPIYLAPTLTPLAETIFLIPLHLAQLTTQAAACQALPLLPLLSTHFSTPPSLTPWFLAAYSLTVGTFILLSGRLGDIFGHKNLLILGYLWFGTFSLACGFSAYAEDNVIIFCVCRAMQGIGPAVVLPNALAILGRRCRTRYIRG